MFSNQDHLRQMFADRFEPDGDGYLFRANLKAPGVRVTAEERDRFVAEFNRAAGRLPWIAGVGTLAVAAAVFWGWLTAFPEREFPQVLIWVLVLACIAAFTLPFQRVWNAPTRTLQARTHAAQARPAAEARRIAIQRQTWPQILGLLAAMLLLLWREAHRHNLLVGWNRLYLVFGGAMVVLVAYVAIRKLRSERRGPPPPP